MIENRKIYWQKSYMTSVLCQNVGGVCPLIRAATDAGIEYRYMIDKDSVKNIWFDYFPHKAQNVNDGEMVRRLKRACLQCQYHMSQQTKKR